MKKIIMALVFCASTIQPFSLENNYKEATKYIIKNRTAVLSASAALLGVLFFYPAEDSKKSELKIVLKNISKIKKINICIDSDQPIPEVEILLSIIPLDEAAQIIRSVEFDDRFVKNHIIDIYHL